MTLSLQVHDEHGLLVGAFSLTPLAGLWVSTAPEADVEGEVVGSFLGIFEASGTWGGSGETVAEEVGWTILVEEVGWAILVEETWSETGGLRGESPLILTGSVPFLTINSA